MRFCVQTGLIMRSVTFRTEEVCRQLMNAYTSLVAGVTLALVGTRIAVPQSMN
jgi:hypothetical protein